MTPIITIFTAVVLGYLYAKSSQNYPGKPLKLY